GEMRKERQYVFFEILMPATAGVTSVADYFRRTEMSGRWRLHGGTSGGVAYAGTAGAEYFAASDPLPQSKSICERGLVVLRPQHRVSFEVATGLRKRSTHDGDSRMIASPR